MWNQPKKSNAPKLLRPYKQSMENKQNNAYFFLLGAQLAGFTDLFGSTDMPGFQTKLLTITIVMMILESSHAILWLFLALLLSQGWLWNFKVSNNPLMFFQTCAKLKVFLTQIFFHALITWYIEYKACVCRSVGTRSLGLAKFYPKVGLKRF